MKKTLLFLIMVASFVSMSVDKVYSPEQAIILFKPLIPQFIIAADADGLGDKLDEILAVPFPEAMKISGDRDFFESGMNRLRADYQLWGTEFSQGWAQQTPNFQHDLSVCIDSISELRERYTAIAIIHTLPEKERRAVIASRLENDLMQFENIRAFYRLREHFLMLSGETLTKEQKAIRNGTAYAYGLHHSEEQLKKWETNAYFTYTPDGTTVPYGKFCGLFVTTYANQLLTKNTEGK